MLRQVVLTEEEYSEIEKIISESNELKNRLTELQNTNEEFKKFKELVAKMFLDENGNFDYNERPIARNTLFLNDEILACLFNYFYKESFLKETKLEVNPYWEFIG